MYSARLVRGNTNLEFAYRPILDGRPIVISFVTRAEVRFGASLGSWGRRRMDRLDEQLATVETAWPDEAETLTKAYAALRTWAVRHGHGIGQKAHEADRWIAATAIRLDLPLVAQTRFSKKSTAWS